MVAEPEAAMLSSEELQYAPLEAKLKEWGLVYTVEREFPIADVTIKAEAQVRDREHLAPKDRVAEYFMQMKNGAVFPPILLRVPGNSLIDGNTRIAAAKRAGRKTLPAILVDTKTEDMAKILAASVNQMGGERLSASEAHEAALLMWGAGYPDAAVAREVGRDLSQVRKWRDQRDALKRADELGLTKAAALLSGTTVSALASIRLDEPFKAMTQLLSEVRPTEKASKAMVAQVVEASSEAVALKVIDDLRQELAPAGPPPRAATRSERPLANAAVGTLLKFEGRPSAVVDPRKAQEELERWQRLARVVNDVIAVLQAAQTAAA